MIRILALAYELMWRNLTLAPIVLGPCLLIVGHNLNQRVPSTRALDWSPIKSNVALLPMQTRIWPVWVVLLAAAIPACALLEELIFRYPVHSLASAILLGGLAFGFIHLTSLVSLRVCLYLVALGLVFVCIYELMGFWAVVLVHASYNLAALSYDAAIRTRRTHV